MLVYDDNNHNGVRGENTLRCVVFADAVRAVV